jgi:hypothetical protein
MMKQTGLVGLASPFTSMGKGRRSRKRRRRSSTASRLSVTDSSFWPVGLRFIQRRMDATQSAARTGSPSWNLRLGRSVIVTRRPSSSVWTPSAICGCARNSASRPNSVSYTMNPWFRVMFAVVQIGSMLVRLACGTMRRARAPAGWPMAKRGSTAAAAVASKARRFILALPMGRWRSPLPEWNAKRGAAASRRARPCRCRPGRR